MAGNEAPETLAPEDVGQWYEDRGWLYKIFMGQNLHIGFWDDAAPDSDPKDNLTDVLIEQSGLRAGRRLLDVGCGTGHPAVRAARATGTHAVGITVAEDQVRTGQELAREAGVADRVRFELVDAVGLPYADASFDAAWACESLMYLADRGAALREIARVLAPGGSFVLSDYTEVQGQDLDDHWRAVLSESFTVSSLPTAAGWAGLIEGAGLTVVRDYDGTPHLRRSASRIEGLVAEHYEEVVEKGGPRYAEEFRATIGEVAELERDHLGYRIITARKPTDR